MADLNPTISSVNGLKPPIKGAEIVRLKNQDPIIRLVFSPHSKDPGNDKSELLLNICYVPGSVLKV